MFIDEKADWYLPDVDFTMLSLLKDKIRHYGILFDDGVLFNSEEKWSSDKCYGINGPWKYYVKWKEISQKTTYYMILFIWNRISKLIETQIRLVVPWG